MASYRKKRIQTSINTKTKWFSLRERHKPKLIHQRQLEHLKWRLFRGVRARGKDSWFDNGV
jgi:hypothetical protein